MITNKTFSMHTKCWSELFSNVSVNVSTILGWILDNCWVK